MLRRRRRALLPFWGPSARAAAPGAGGRAAGSRRGRRRGSPRCSGRRQQVGQPGVAREHLRGVRSPRVWPPSPGFSVPAPPSRLTPQAACSGGNFAGAWRRRSWARRCGSGEPRARGLPDKGSPGGWALSGGREPSPSGSGRGDPQFCGGAPRPQKVSEKILGASSEREALKCHHFPGQVKMRLQLPGSQVGNGEGRERGAGVAWGGVDLD